MHVGMGPVRLGQETDLVFTALLGCIDPIRSITHTGKKANRPPWGTIGLLALLISANSSLIYNPPRDMTFPGRIKIIFPISFSYQFDSEYFFSTLKLSNSQTHSLRHCATCSYQSVSRRPKKNGHFENFPRILLLLD
jgi:hypothetical protein